jgi:ankyrin repeat protein
VIEGNEAKLKKVIRLGLTINCLDEKQRLPLHYACKNGLLNIVNFLIDCGSDCRSTDSKGLTPLELGIVKGHNDLNHVFI